MFKKGGFYMGDILKKYSLFARPGFATGMARVFDFSVSLNQYNYSSSPQEADWRALQSDWNAVRNDMKAAINEFKAEQDIDE